MNMIEVNKKLTTDLSGIQQFLDGYNVEHLKNSLIEFPELILTQKAAIRKAKDAFKDADQPRQLLELEMADDIAMEKDSGSGKAKYSNDKARDNELMRRKVANKEYRELNRQSREAAREVSAAEDELERLENKFKAYRYVTALVTAELSVIAGSLAEEWPTEEINAVNNGSGKGSVYGTPAGKEIF